MLGKENFIINMRNIYIIVIDICNIYKCNINGFIEYVIVVIKIF